MRYKQNKHNEFFVVDLAYDDLIVAEVKKRGLSPKKATQFRENWIRIARSGHDDAGWLAEYERNFDVTLGKRVYPRFSIKDYVRTLVYNQYRSLLRSWDFGFHRPAVVFAQIDPTKEFPVLYLLSELMAHDMEIHDFIPLVKAHTKRLFPEITEFKDFCDPAGSQVNDKSERSSIDILNDQGICPSYRRSPIKEGIDLVRDLMRDKRFYIDTSCEILIRGFLGGYAYPEVQENKPENEMPQKDGYYDHLQDALRYMVINMLTLFKTPAPKEKKPPFILPMAESVVLKKEHWYYGN